MTVNRGPLSESWSCTTKLPYVTRAEARIVLRQMIAHGRGTNKQIYRCVFGDHFHIGLAIVKGKRGIAFRGGTRRASTAARTIAVP